MASLPSRKPNGAASAEDVPRLRGRRLWLTVAAMVLGLAAVIVLVSLNAEDVGDALALTNSAQLAALVGLHLAALILRAEAWGLCLAAAGKPLPRRRLHAASSLRFLVDTAVPTYVGAWVRIAILKRLEGDKAPTVGQMITADGVLLLVEAIITVVLLIGCSVLAGLDWYLPLLFAMAAAAALGGVVILRRRFANRAFVRVFDVLSDSQHRVLLTVLLTIVLTIQSLRFYISLHAVGLDASALQSLLTFVTTSAINALPIGPGPASVGATVSVFGRDGVGAATASGLVLAASAFVAAGLYSVWGGYQLLRTRREAPAAAAADATPARPADAA